MDLESYVLVGLLLFLGAIIVFVGAIIVLFGTFQDHRVY